MKTLLLGDIHGSLGVLNLALTKLAEVRKTHPEARLIQLGDFGFGAEWAALRYMGIPKEELLVLGGNHDDYNYIRETNPANYLGDYGLVPNTDAPTFYVRGAQSIDKGFRTPEVSWWPEEELSVEELEKALELYVETKPTVMLTHEAPTTVNVAIHGTCYYSRTNQYLDLMLREHKPERWYFGHHHVNWDRNVFGTQFRCLDINHLIEVDL